MTEDDTFNALKKWSYEQITSSISKLQCNNGYEPYWVEIDNLIKNAGWTVVEYQSAQWHKLFGDVLK